MFVVGEHPLQSSDDVDLSGAEVLDHAVADAVTENRCHRRIVVDVNFHAVMS